MPGIMFLRQWIRKTQASSEDEEWHACNVLKKCVFYFQLLQVSSGPPKE